MRAAGTAVSGWASGLGAVLALALTGCIGGQTGSEWSGERGSASAGSAAPGLEPPSGMGPSCDQRQCLERAQHAVDALRARRAEPRLVAASCEVGACGAACSCLVAREGALTAELELYDPLVCSQRGDTGACLWLELPPCTPGACACTTECADLVAAIAADDARAPQATVHAASCERDGCRIVIAIGDQCFAGERADARVEVDCATLERLVPADVDATRSSEAVQGCGAGGSVALGEVQDAGLARCLGAEN